MSPTKADMVVVWKGAQAAFRGQDPYAHSTMREIQRIFYGRELTPKDTWNRIGFAYPMYTIVLFAPIALLPWQIVRLGFLILLPIITAASVILWVRVVDLRPSRRNLALIVVLSLCSWPAVWAFDLIQPTLVVGALAAAGCYLVRRGSMAMAGLVFALATIKPQLIALLVLWLLLWTVLQGTWRFLVSFCLTLASLLALATLLLPTWVHGWRAAMAEYAVYRHLQLETQQLFGHWIGLILAALIATVGLTVLWQQRRCAPGSREFGAMCAFSLALTVGLQPTERAMVYNQVLLFPACFLIIGVQQDAYYARLARLVAIGMILLSFALVALAVLGESIFGPSVYWDNVPFETALLPIAILIALAYPFLQGSAALADQGRMSQAQTADQ